MLQQRQRDIQTHQEEELPVLNRQPLSMRNTIREQTANTLLEAIHTVETAYGRRLVCDVPRPRWLFSPSDYQRLFLASIPHRRPLNRSFRTRLPRRLLYYWNHSHEHERLHKTKTNHNLIRICSFICKEKMGLTGWQIHSNAPNKVRTITRPVKFLHAAVPARTAPHAKMLEEEWKI